MEERNYTHLLPYRTYVFRNAGGEKFSTRCLSLELAQLRAWAVDPTFQLIIPLSIRLRVRTRTLLNKLRRRLTW